jgi:hypothetical protein
MYIRLIDRRKAGPWQVAMRRAHEKMSKQIRATPAPTQRLVPSGVVTSNKNRRTGVSSHY